MKYIESEFDIFSCVVCKTPRRIMVLGRIKFLKCLLMLGT